MVKHLRAIVLIALFLLLSFSLAQLDWQIAVASPPSQANSPLPPPPANDNFGRAKVIQTLPYGDNLEITYATLQAREPRPTCLYSAPGGQTVWYKFTPATSGTFMLDVTSNNTYIGIYTGSALTDLAQQRCFEPGFWSTSLQLTGGVTYYFQMGDAYNSGNYLHFQLEAAPAPEVSINYEYYYTPSTLDTVTLYSYVYNLFNENVAQWTWDLGDGTNTTESTVQHRYAADGDYQVTLSIVTTGGRTATTSRVISVRTHDVTIKKLARPASARVGQTRKVVVSVSNSRYPENVRVELYKSVPGGFAYVGFLQQYVNAKPKGQVTDFYLGYTFTPEDAQVGKVIFKAVAGIEDQRDAFPADNEFISFAVKVTGGGRNSATGSDDAINSAAVDEMSDYVTDDESNVTATLEDKGGEAVGDADFRNFLPLVNK